MVNMLVLQKPMIIKKKLIFKNIRWACKPQNSSSFGLGDI
jgi:hypothetical protein